MTSEGKFELIDSAPTSAAAKFDRVEARFYARAALDAVRRSEFPVPSALG